VSKHDAAAVKVIPTNNPPGVMKGLTVWPHGSFFVLYEHSMPLRFKLLSRRHYQRQTQPGILTREQDCAACEAATERNSLRLSEARYEDNRHSRSLKRMLRAYNIFRINDLQGIAPFQIVSKSVCGLQAPHRRELVTRNVQKQEKRTVPKVLRY
jgi:hypothetical protein